MTLRLILVGLVTSMGLELPSGRDVSSWAESGRAWVDARLADTPASGVEVVAAEESAAPEPAIVAAALCLQPDSDLAFRSVSDGMAADFASDRAATIAALSAPAGSLESVAEAEMPAVGLPDGEEVAPVFATDVEVASEDAEGPVADPDGPALAHDDDGPSRADRLASAVRLTREAAHAWVSLIQDSADEGGPAR